MRNLKALLCLLLLAGAAQAGGSIQLDEMMEQLKDDATLIGEINAELAKQNLKADGVTCSGARFGGHWVELGGARSVPYECEIGTKKLNVDGTLRLYDESGNEIDMSDEKAPERAFSYKETDLKWKWD